MKPPIDSINRVYPLIWRFFPILDQDVDVLLVRDLDSHISMREVSAVKEFLNSTKDFHIMRDHPFHIQPIMGGLWGIRLTMNRTKNKAVFRWSTYHLRFFHWLLDHMIYLKQRKKYTCYKLIKAHSLSKKLCTMIPFSKNDSWCQLWLG